ncbi:MAG TPA: carboxylesterase/lipase family protein [Acidimicrobiales bacterium]
MIVTTAQGRLEGLEGDGVWHFRGIPYAAPPVGERRFRPPAPPASWDGVRPAKEFGSVSWQGNTGVSLLLGEKGGDASEDCLFLNVTTPACDDDARPVLVWIHGGGFMNGSSSSSWYEPTRMASRGDVVVVTVNYRLGALGFLWLGDLDTDYTSSGVNGLLDQAEALRWVQQNIAAFGGDPGNVTLFGESAGAMSVSTLLALPTARGLFHRVVAQSGAASNTFDRRVAGEITSSVMNRLGVTELDGLLAVEPSALSAAAVKVTGEVFHDPGRIAGPTGIALAMAFQPVVDGEWLPEDPLEAMRAGTAADVAVVVGSNADEWNLFRLLSPGGLDHPELLDRLDRIFGAGHVIHDTYAAVRPDAGPDELWSAILTDATFRIPAVRLLEARAEGGAISPSYQYLFSWPTPAFGGLVGSCHALEIPFVFGTMESAQAELVLGGSTGPELWALSDAIQDAWLAFARTGRPSVPRAPAWPAWDREVRSVMRLDTTREVLSDPSAAERELWEGVL